MSVTATIESPQDERERSFNIPICTESLLRDLIMPLAELHGLSLIAEWGAFVKIDHESKDLFSRELGALCEYIGKLENVSLPTKRYTLERMNILSNEVNKMFEKRSNIEILIG